MASTQNPKGGKKSTASSGSSSSVTVCVRIRPENDAERKAGQPVAFMSSEGGVEELDEMGHVSKTWPYDYAFGPECNNRYIFDTAGASLIESALEGYNTVMFMYGQTSSGKTFTLFGGGGVLGVVDHSIEMVYNSIMNSVDTEYVVKVVFIELYNEEIKDLLAVEHNENLKIIEDPILGPSILNIREESFVDIAETRRILDEGDRRRHFGVTNMNAHSSRSHVLVRLNIEARKVYGGQLSKPLRQSWGKDKPTCFSTLNLVDLAGSERANKAGTSGQSLKEGSYINKSLLTLGTVIAHLSDDSKSQAHIPYRNSKLTRLLATALGGNARTSMVACISPARGNAHESLSTLRFASRAKKVVNVVRKNLFDDARSLAELLAKQKTEMEVLREELERSKLHGFSEGPMKEKAIDATRRLRSLKFIVMNSNQLVKALGKEGKHAIANNVRNSVRSAVQGSREISEVLDEHRDVMLNHFADNSTMMAAVAVIDHLNDLDVLSLDREDDDGNSVNSFQYPSIDDLGDIVGDLVDEENATYIERIKMTCEEYRTIASNRINALLDENKEQAKKIVEYKRENGELTAELRTTSAEVEALSFAEGALKQTVEEIKRQMEEARVDHIEKISGMQQQINELESATETGEKSILTFQQALSAKDHELSRLQTSCDQLSKEIEKRDQEMQNVQSESAKSRAQQRTQVEQLRSNMHSLRQQGGETTKVLELQNSFLHRDCELLRDELEAVRSSKSQLMHEVTLLRADVQRYVSEFQQMSEELSYSKSEAATASQQVVGLKTRMARLTTRCSLLEEENTNVKRQLSEANKELVNATEVRSTEVKAIKTSSSTTIAELRNSLAVATNELQCSQELLLSKDADLQRYVLMLKSDDNRLESKMRAEVQRNEILLSELYAERMHSNENNVRFAVESRALKARIVELEQWMSSVQAFIGRHTESETQDIDDDFPEDRDIFDDDIGEPGMSPMLHPGEVSWSGDGSPEKSPRRRGSMRLSFGISGPLVTDDWEDEEDAEHLDAQIFAKLTSPQRAMNADLSTPKKDQDTSENINMPHTSSLRKLFPLPATLSSDMEEAYKMAPSDAQRIDTTNAAGRKRMEAVYDKLLNRPSVPYLRLKFGLKALKTIWSHAVNEDALLRNYIVTVAEQNYSSSHNSDRTVNKINKHTAYLQHRVDELEAVRDDVLSSYNELKDQVDSLSMELSQSNDRYADTVVSMDELAANNEALKSRNSVLSSKYDNIQQDFNNLFHERNNMVLSVKKLNLNISELQLSNDLLQGKLDQIMQRLSVTIVQRDELVRQFLGDAQFEEDELGVETLTGTADGGSYYVDSDDGDSIDIDTNTMDSSPRSLRRKSSIRSDTSGRFIPWT